MRLLYSPTSPYARKVRVLLAEKGMAIAMAAVDAQGSDPDLAAANPLHKVPALQRDAGGTLYDSRVICEYLDAIGPGPRLLPAEGEARWTALRRMALADGVLDAAVATVLERRRAEDQRSQHWLGRWDRAIRRGVAAMGDDLAAMEPGGVDLARIGFACALDYLDFRLPDIAWRDGCSDLADWNAAFLGRPSMRATDPRA